ncbi:hypothetical protein CYMTET_56709 [Cymbomonas tetramitiformis]|uniref:Uncharacterized protein n=1 Tax=Cymbomonas tetramitiformis TaxID=36881 RepID=A0AAE0BAS3_9CHLO|nr:hypothetical protein CYMTET_56709 [Cymbomonas tetramitiformis]
MFLSTVRRSIYTARSEFESAHLYLHRIPYVLLGWELRMTSHACKAYPPPLSYVLVKGIELFAEFLFSVQPAQATWG